MIITFILLTLSLASFGWTLGATLNGHENRPAEFWVSMTIINFVLTVANVVWMLR